MQMRGLMILYFDDMKQQETFVICHFTLSTVYKISKVSQHRCRKNTLVMAVNYLIFDFFFQQGITMNNNVLFLLNYIILLHILYVIFVDAINRHFF